MARSCSFETDSTKMRLMIVIFQQLPILSAAFLMFHGLLMPVSAILPAVLSLT